MSSIRQNLHSVKERIATACSRAGRTADAVTLIAVTKTVGEEEIRELYSLGVRDFGENRVESIIDKLHKLEDLTDINWHFIGHLQRNKARSIIGKVAAIHSVESAGLLDIIASCQGSQKVFIEVNISGELSKYGLHPSETDALIEKYINTVDIVGLMTMAPYSDDPEETRVVFAGLRDLRDLLEIKADVSMPFLSMGMSNDFEVAVEEGATHVRVGSELFK